MSRATPLGAVTRGLAAGLLGTALFTGYRTLRGRGDVESPEEARGSDWSEAPPPAQVGQRLVEGVFQHDVPREKGGRLQMIVHFGYGTFWGAVYGLVHESRKGSAAVDGVGLAAAVVATDYTLLPAMGLYRPPWNTRRRRSRRISAITSSMASRSRARTGCSRRCSTPSAT